MITISVIFSIVAVISVLMLFSFITAYVISLGVRGTGIHFDYMLFVLYTLVALKMGGAI